MTSRKTSTERRIEELLHRLEPGDTLIVTELSRLGRNTAEIIALVNELVTRGIRLIALKQHIDLSVGEHDMSSKIIVTVFSVGRTGARFDQHAHKGSIEREEKPGSPARQT